jgi:ABC-type cobalamin/Fe3+-siderophores transport system ATPase subunit
VPAESASVKMMLKFTCRYCSYVMTLTRFTVHTHTHKHTHTHMYIYYMYTVGCAKTNANGSRTSFVIASVLYSYNEIYVFRGNPFQAHR